MMFFDNLRDAGLVLFLGKGNFSFSANVLRRSQEQNMSKIYATCYEKEIELNVDEASLNMERMVIMRNTERNYMKKQYQKMKNQIQ